MAIRFRGMLMDLKMLEEGCCPTEAHQLEESGSLDEILNQSLKKSLPIFLLMLALALVRFHKGLHWEADFSIVGVLVGGFVTVVLYSIFVPLHEYIHAIFLPRHSDKDIWIYQMQAALVYCNAPMSRMRFIIMSAAPATILGFIPYAAWLLFAQVPSVMTSIYWMLLSWSMVFGGIGDFYNVSNVWNQVPKGAMVFNYGMHTYWIEKKDIPSDWK